MNPSAIELMDKFLLDKTRASVEYSRYIDFVDGNPEAILVTEFYGESESELDSKVAGLKALLTGIGHRGTVTIAQTAQQQANVLDSA